MDGCDAYDACERKQTKPAIADDFALFFKKHYRDTIESLIANGRSSFLIRQDDLLKFDLEHSMDVYGLLLSDPPRFFECAGLALKQIMKESQQAPPTKRITVRIESFPDIVEVGKARQDPYLEKLITVEAIVSAIGDIVNQITCVYECEKGHEVTIEGIEQKPDKCRTCSSTHWKLKEQLAHSKQAFYMVQRQSGNRNTHTLKVILSEELIDSVSHGDAVRVTGLVKPERLHKSNEYQNVLEANNIDFLNRQNIELTEQDIEDIKTFAKRSDAYPQLIENIASSILGKEDVKESLLLQMVGSEKVLLDDGTTRRGEMNIVLIGDPGLAKSELLLAVTRNTPGGVYASGTGASGLGLTGGIKKMHDGTAVVEAGAVVLANGSICAIDEFDKMREEDRDKMHTQMEHGVVPIHKIGGIDIQFEANTSILAAANPVGSRYDSAKTFYENVNIKPSLITRFDWLWIVQDKVEQELDRELASHVLQTFDNELPRQKLDREFLLKYIAYAKSIHPSISDRAKELIVDFYESMRRSYREEGEKFTITPRHLESVIRAVKARARVLLKNEVDEEDCASVFQLYKKMLKSIEFKIHAPETYIEKGAEICIKILLDSPDALSVETLYEKARDQLLQPSDFVKVFGDTNNLRENWKLRTIIEHVKENAAVTMIKRKPLMLAYNKMQARVG